MCESTVYVMKGNEREMLMKDVVKAAVEGGKVKVTNILGESKIVAGRLVEVNLLGHSLTIIES